MKKLLATLSATAVMAIPAGGAQAAANPWHTMTFKDQTTGVTLTAVDALSATDAWAGGENLDAQPSFDHWNGAGWVPVTGATVPNVDAAYIDGVKVFASAVWAVGTWTEDPASQGSFVEHSTNGKTFTMQKLAAFALYGIDGASATNMFAVGTGTTNAPATIWHYDGTSWKKSFSVTGARGEFDSVAVVSASDAWAVGETTTDAGATVPLSAHWNGSKWTKVKLPGAGNAVFAMLGVAASSATNVWSAGFASADSDICSDCNAIADTLTGGAWTPNNPPSYTTVHELDAVATTGPSNVWAVGTRYTAGGDSYNLLDHWNGSAWTSLGGPNAGTYNDLMGITSVPGQANSFWAVGPTADGSAILRCC